ncbi:hypothetical protein RRF57_007643 [Xylaria bambusicola]|uniref:Uncharacterized protein n=1 Tax=Xylaria bambusicola TaxID=326684 RepID=A0AAN7UQT7_9PEZI
MSPDTHRTALKCYQRRLASRAPAACKPPVERVDGAAKGVVHALGNHHSRRHVRLDIDDSPSRDQDFGKFSVILRRVTHMGCEADG